MAAYKVDTYETGPLNSVAEITALLEVHLETLDSTTNVLRAYGIARVGNKFQGWLIYDIA